MQQPDYRPMNKSELARALEVEPKGRAAMRKALTKLEEEGQVSPGKKSRYALVARRDDQLRGSIKFTPKGHAWFFADMGDPDNVASGLDLEDFSRVYVPRRDTADALDGDRVLVTLEKRRPRPGDFRRNRDRRDEQEDEYRARVERVLDRRSGKVVGVFRKSGRFETVEADDLAVQGAVQVQGDHTARPGQMVVVSIDQWDGEKPSGRIIEVLGWPDDAGVDILAIIHKNGLRTTFPDEVLNAARGVPDEVDPAEAKRREDWRDRLVITIDPADAKDHDDAIWCERTKNGWKLAVHIADVSHYVKPRTPLDQEAIERGNSTYLVDRVIPMLPVELSNGICSLKPDVDRLTKCCVLDINSDGSIARSRFCDAVIHSQAKLSYEQAQAILDGGGAPEGSRKDLAPMVREAWQMASVLRKRRFASGALDLEMPETRIRLGEDGKPVAIDPVEHSESHQLIEECMLIANESVARLLKGRNKPAIYRIHEDPDFSRLVEYGETAQAFGYDFGDLTNKKHIQQLLDAARGRPDEHAIKVGLLKSLKRAAYHHDPLGHYGLSKADYCHFTSPIRRYADLIVHRALQPLLVNPPAKPDKTPRHAELAEIARHISDTERASADAENESKKIKLLEYLDACTRADEPVVFEGLITEVRAMGLMVEATHIGTRGVVMREDLPGGGWRFEESQARFSGPGGKQFQLGERVELEVARIDFDRRFVDFRIAGAAGEGGGRPETRRTRAAKKTGGRSGGRSDGREKDARQGSSKKRSGGSSGRSSGKSRSRRRKR